MDALVKAAANPKADPAKLNAVYDVYKRVLQDVSVRSFNAAMANAKGEIGPVTKTRTVDFTSQKGRTNYRYEDFASVANAVDPAFARYGLAYRFRTEQPASARVRVTCIISHVDGYSEETSLEAAPDSSGQKNDVQAIGSIVTYLQRYTLKAALGLAATVDDDGRGGRDEPTQNQSPDNKATRRIGEEELLHLQEAIKASGATVENVEKWAKCPLDQMSVELYERAIVSLGKRTATKPTSVETAQ